MTDFLTDLLNSQDIKKISAALRFFEGDQNNILKTINYLNEFTASIEKKVIYLNYARSLFSRTCSLTNFIEILSVNTYVFSGVYLKAVEGIIENAKYFNGSFDSAYSEIKKIIPLSSLKSINQEKRIERLIFNLAQSIYSMEGNQAYIYNIINSSEFPETKKSCAAEIGIFNVCEFQFFDFSYFEHQYLIETIKLEEIDEYLANIYKKSHIEIMQTSFIRAKVKPFDKKHIDKLIVVNPYTLGLKYLMLAFFECDLTIAGTYYLKAINELEHIKFYYVEAIYWHAKFLKENGLKEYDDVYLNGHRLANKHYYRYLEYLFDELDTPTGLVYNSARYPLPSFESLSDIEIDNLV